MRVHKHEAVVAQVREEGERSKRELRERLEREAEAKIREAT